MKKINLILILLIIVGVVSVSGCISYQPNTSNVTLSDLNDSDVEELKTIDDIKNVNKPVTPVKPVDGLLSKEEIKKAYQNMFNFTNATVSVTGPYKMANGTYYYIVDVEEKISEDISILHLEVDAKVKPELIDAQGFEAKGVLSEYFYTFKKDDGSLPEAKISQKDIIAKANELYKKNGENQKVVNVELFSTKDNKVVYIIDLGNIIYDANTGELIHCAFANEVTNELSEEKCRVLAQKELDKLDINGAYLTNPVKINEMGGFIYSYNVSYDIDGSTMSLGHIEVDPFSLAVVNVDVIRPTINQSSVDINQSDDLELLEEYEDYDDVYVEDDIGYII